MATYTINLSDGITESFIHTIERIAGERLLLKKRLTEIAIELVQNIQKHGLEKNKATFIIHKDGARYLLTGSNLVNVKDVQPLTEKINFLNTLNQIQLKKYHTQKLRHTTFTEKFGAGLGLCRIAILSATALAFSFTRTDQQHLSFSLRVTLTA